MRACDLHRKALIESMRYYPEGEEPEVMIRIPSVPPSLNRLNTMHWGVRRAKYKAFEELVRTIIAVRRIKAYRCPVELLVTCVFPTKRNRDRDNYCFKWLKDALKYVVLRDDDPRYVVREEVEFDIDPHCEPYMRVLIRPVREGVA
jgi:hypothetical protein